MLEELDKNKNLAFPFCTETSHPIKTAFLNRELSWLAFNERVLAESYNLSYPLLERLHFLAISASNLDEFFMARFSPLALPALTSSPTNLSLGSDGLRPEEQLAVLNHQLLNLMKKQSKQWGHLREELRRNNFAVISPHELRMDDYPWLERYFFNNIFPALTPLAIDASHPIPSIPSCNLSFVIELKDPTNNFFHALLPLPPQLGRFVRLPGLKVRYITMEHVINLFMKHLFSHFTICKKGLFRFIRDSIVALDLEASDIASHFEDILRQRLHGTVVRLFVDAHMPEPLQLYSAEQWGVKSHDVLVVNGLLGLSDLSQLIGEERKDLQFRPFIPRIPQRIRTVNEDLFEAIAIKDIIVHHPYEDFEVVLKFLKQAARDPHVLAIKQTLYRTSNNSPIVRELIEAAEQGKTVTALVEIKARFDEKNNLRWAKDMEDAGVQVIYGIKGLKTHAKVTLVVRREGQQLRSYAHFGTGNYNPGTAMIYTDLSFFTADPMICKDASYIFNYISGYTRPDCFLEKLAVSPLDLRQRLLLLIQSEVEQAKQGNPAQIWAKLNALTDPVMIKALYQASQAGVQILLIVRGSCCLRPGIAGLSENIQVKSLVGRFLEHARIICFGNGYLMPSPQAKVFITSADWMERNFERRLEVLIPIENPTVHQQVLEQIMIANINDQSSSWYLQPDGIYQRSHSPGKGFSAQDYFLSHSSLSGNGLGPYRLNPGIIAISETN